MTPENICTIYDSAQALLDDELVTLSCSFMIANVAKLCTLDEVSTVSTACLEKLLHEDHLEVEEDD